MRFVKFTSLLVILFSTFGSLNAMATTPEPSYQVLKTDGAFQIRRYTPQLAADVTLPAAEASTSDAFRILAAYIFKEYPSGPIGMTAPVTTQRTHTIGMTAPVTTSVSNTQLFMRFYLPERYTLKTLPKPDDSRIKIVEIPARTVATVRFNGWLSSPHVAEQHALLRQWLTTQSLTPAGPAEVQGYNPPWTLPWWRRNEIWIPLANPPTN